MHNEIMTAKNEQRMESDMPKGAVLRGRDSGECDNNCGFGRESEHEHESENW